MRSVRRITYVLEEAERAVVPVPDHRRLAHRPEPRLHQCRHLC